MKIIIKNKDISELVDKITFSGDIRSVSRKLSFSIANVKKDFYSSSLDLKIDVGDIVSFYDDSDNLVFLGAIFDISKSSSKKSLDYTAFDFLYYVKKSSISKIFDDTAENITKSICSELGIKTKDLAKTGIKTYLPSLDVNAYDTIMKAYTIASRTTLKKYMIKMTEDTLNVVEIGLDSGVVLDGSYNLLDANYTISLQSLVNKVLVVNDVGKVIDKVENLESIKKYGLIQKSAKDSTEAKSLLHSIDKTISVSAISDLRALAGTSLLFKDTDDKIYASFFIESDSHSFSGSSKTMNLKLRFDKIMDEKG